MDLANLNELLIEIIEKRNVLNKMNYGDDRYDEVEDELHDLEDDFSDEFGDFLDKKIDEAHRAIKSDDDVLDPIAYIPSACDVLITDTNDKIFTANFGDGIKIDADAYEGQNTSIALLPNPLRLELLIGLEEVKTLWTEVV